MPKTRKESESTDTDSDSGPDDRKPPPKKARETTVDTKEKEKDTPKQWTLEKLRQVRINEFRGRKMVDIREFYEKNGEILPGKKGISLSIQQWQKLLECKDEINRALAE